MALEGDTNGDFLAIEDDDETLGISPRGRAIDALLDYMDTLLLGDTMTAEYRAALRHSLFSGRGINSSDPANEASNIVREAYRLIATSSAYLTQQ